MVFNLGRSLQLGMVLNVFTKSVYTIFVYKPFTWYQSHAVMKEILSNLFEYFVSFHRQLLYYSCISQLFLHWLFVTYSLCLTVSDHFS